MDRSSKKQAWVVGLTSAVPLLFSSTPALAETSGAGVMAWVGSAVAGCALGSLVAGGVGFSAWCRQRDRYEELLDAHILAQDATLRPSPARPQMTPGAQRHADVNASSEPEKLSDVFVPADSKNAKKEPTGEMGEEMWASANDEGSRSGIYEFEASQYAPHSQKAPLAAAQTSAPQEAHDFSLDYDRVAQAYVERTGLKNRVKDRAKSVAEVLNERMGTALLDGVPVIERADGSVGDIGTSWWHKLPQVSERGSSNSLGAVTPKAAAAAEANAGVRTQKGTGPVLEKAPSLSSSAPSPWAQASVQPVSAPRAPSALPQSLAQAPQSASLKDASVSLAAKIPQVMSAAAHWGEPVSSQQELFGSTGAHQRLQELGPVAQPQNQGAPARSALSQLIAQRVRPVEQEAYPEKKTNGETSGDGWEQALAALDTHGEDNLMRSRPLPRAEHSVRPILFGDGVGSAETLDEPDGLEKDTQFLRFRAPGNHPEVQDTNSYIKYLVDDEFGRRKTAHGRHQAQSTQSFLRVYEGGHHRQAQAM